MLVKLYTNAFVSRSHRPTMILGVLALVVALVLLGRNGRISSAKMMADSTVPRAAIVTGEGVDFASVEVGDPWDMSSITDIYNERSQNVTSSAGANRLAIENGMLVGTTTTTDPQIFLQWPGYPGFQSSYAKYGINTPINADRYRYFVMRMYVDNVTADAAGRLFWARGMALSQFGLSKPIPIHSGWFTYVIDLKTIGIDGGTQGWNGNFHALRLGPINNSNVNFKIDWIRLVSETDLPTYNIPFQANAGVVSLYAAPTNTQPDTTTVIATSLNTALGSYTWPAGLLPPSDYYIYEVAGIDYAGLALGTPWNMTSTNQYSLNELNLNSLSGGILNVSPNGADPSITFALNPNTPIDGSVFNRFAIKMNASGLQSGRLYAWQIFWRTVGDPSAKSTDLNFEVVAGEQTYAVDLSGRSDWHGKKIEWLRFDIGANGSMTSLSLAIDWAALTTAVVPGNESQLMSTGSFAPDWVQVKSAPSLSISAPSYTSGADYATTVLGNAWDMNSADDIIATAEIVSMNTANGVLTFMDDLTNRPSPTPGKLCDDTGDPQLTLRTGQYFRDSRTAIDPSRYRYLTFGYKEDHPTDTCLGSITRFLGWENNASNTTEFEASVTKEGWNTYAMDLATAHITAGNPVWDSHSTINVFRFDPNEIPGKHITGHLDYVTLTSKPWSDASYTVKWSRATGDTSAQVKVYQDSDTNPNNGKTLLATTTLGAGSYLWNTSALAEGSYYVYLEIDDGVNQPRAFYSRLPVTVKRQAAVTFTIPNRSTVLSDDFATKNGNEWDFANDSDLNKNAPFPPTGYNGLSNVAVNGTFKATTNSDDSNIFLNMAGGATINTGQYNKLRFRMYSGYTAGIVNAQLIWYSVGGNIGQTDFISVEPGWGVYAVDLAADGEWTGNVQYIRFDPMANSNVDFQIDWVHLAGPKTLNVSWTKQNFDARTRLSLQATPDAGGEAIWVARNQTGTSFAWDVAGLQPGIYTITALVDDRVSDINNVVDTQKYSLGSAGVPLLQVPATFTVLAEAGDRSIGNILISNGGGGFLNWSASSNQSWLTLPRNSGSTVNSDYIGYQVDGSGLAVGNHQATITVNAGAGGTQTITVNVIVVANLLGVYLPSVLR